MDSILKTYMNDQQAERIAHMITSNFEKVTGKKTTEDEYEFTIMVAKQAFEQYIIENREDIRVAGDESRERLNELLDAYTQKISTLIVHYIYSRLEAYILYKQLKTLQGKDE